MILLSIEPLEFFQDHLGGFFLFPKRILGQEHSFCGSPSSARLLWVSNPQQFHLSTTKEPGEEEPESPVSSLTSPVLVKLVAVCEDLAFPFFWWMLVCFLLLDLPYELWALAGDFLICDIIILFWPRSSEVVLTDYGRFEFCRSSPIFSQCVLGWIHCLNQFSCISRSDHLGAYHLFRVEEEDRVICRWAMQHARIQN